MNIITALAISIGVLGGIATWASVTLGHASILIWAIFIAWASYFHCGGKIEGLKASAVANIWGSLCAAAALMGLLALGVNAVNAGICVGLTVLIMIAAARIPVLGAIPAGVYGYASTAALFLLGGAGYGEGNAAVIGVAVAIIASMVIGNVLGYVSEQVAGALMKASKSHKYEGGCAHVHTHSDVEPIDNHICHCNVCKNVTGQLTTHVVFFRHGDLKVSNEANLDRVPFNAENPDGPLQLCLCKDCGTPIMVDDKERRLRAVVPNLMGYDPAALEADYHAFYEASKGYKVPSDGRPVCEGLRPEFAMPSAS